MADAMLDARQEGGSYRRIGVDHRGAAPAAVDGEEKARIERKLRGRGQYFRGCSAAMALSVATHGMAAQVHDGRGVQAPGFVPVRIACEGRSARTGEPGRLAPAHTCCRRLVMPQASLAGWSRSR